MKKLLGLFVVCLFALTACSSWAVTCTMKEGDYSMSVSMNNVNGEVTKLKTEMGIVLETEQEAKAMLEVYKLGIEMSGDLEGLSLGASRSGKKVTISVTMDLKKILESETELDAESPFYDMVGTIIEELANGFPSLEEMKAEAESAGCTCK